jgi:glycosyltransferase involved in cell wall biosynthesis
MDSTLNPNIEETIPSLPFQKVAPCEGGRIRVLHVMGHLLRGGIEMWLYQMIKRLDPSHFSHHILVRTADREPFTESFRQAGVRVIPCLHFKNPPVFALNFIRAMRENGPYDIVHIHGSSLSGLTCLLVARAMGVKRVIVHSHNDLSPLLETSSAYYRLYCRMVCWLYRTVPDLGFACSERAAESMFGGRWKQSARFQLLYYGVDFDPFSAEPDPGLRSRIGIPRDAFVIGHVGRLHEQKNHEFLLQVAEAMVRRGPGAHFLLIGDGPLRPQITSEIQRRGLSEHVTLVPDTTSVPSYMTGAMDCFLLPSRYEGLGLVAVEAQAAGLPCLLSDRIPAEATVIPSLVRVLSLDQPAEEWADQLCAMREAGPAAKSAKNLKLLQASRFNVHNCVDLLASTYRRISGRPNLESGLEPDLKSDREPFAADLSHAIAAAQHDVAVQSVSDPVS